MTGHGITAKRRSGLAALATVAVIVAVLLFLRDPPGRASGTDGDGREVSDRGTSVEPEAPGQGARERSEIPTPDVPTTGVPTTGGRRVVDAETGRPVPGAVFQVFLGRDSMRPAVRAVTDAEGRLPAEPFEALASGNLEGWCIVARGYRALAAEARPEEREFRMTPSREVRIVLKGLAEVARAGYEPRASIAQPDFTWGVLQVIQKSIQQAGIDNRCEITGAECRVRPFVHEETVFYVRLVKGSHQQVAAAVAFEPGVFRYEVEVALPDPQAATGDLHLVLSVPRELDSRVAVYIEPPLGNRISYDPAFLPELVSSGSGSYDGWIHDLPNGDYNLIVDFPDAGPRHYGQVAVQGTTVYRAAVRAALLRLDGFMDGARRHLGPLDASIEVRDSNDRFVCRSRVDDRGHPILFLPDTAFSWEGLGTKRRTGRKRLDRHPIPTWIVLLDSQVVTLVLDDRNNRSRSLLVTDLDQDLSYRESVYFLAGKGDLPLVPGRYRLELEGHEPLEVLIPRDTGKQLRLR